LSARNLAAAPRRFPFARPARPTPTPAARLAEIHRRLIIRGGSFQEEFPEQLMAAAYIRPDDYVLEIGANIGRNTLVIASLLADSSRLLTLECDPASFATLLLNKNLNRMNFKVENSALSKQRLEQKEWNTRPLLTPTPSPGWKEIRTVDYPQLLAKHNFPPPTAIVADCEGALFHILREEPAILQNLQRLLVENDYPRPEEQAAVEEILRLAGMRPVYAAPIVSNIWGSRPNFYEVWEKIPAAGNSQDQI